MRRFIYGYDFGSKVDPTGIAIHDASPIPPGQPKVPKLVHLEEYLLGDYTKLLHILKTDLWRRFPPYFHVTDYTREETMTDIITRIFGKQRVLGLKFTNQSKQKLKDDALAILQQGYKFPNPKQVKDTHQRTLLEKLLKQMRQEQMILTPSRLIRYDHPEGEHNDMLNGWELSITGSIKLLVTGGTKPAAASGGYKTSSGFGIPDQSKYAPEVRGTRADVSIYWPN